MCRAKEPGIQKVSASGTSLLLFSLRVIKLLGRGFGWLGCRNLISERARVAGHRFLTSTVSQSLVLLLPTSQRSESECSNETTDALSSNSPVKVRVSSSASTLSSGKEIYEL